MTGDGCTGRCDASTGTPPVGARLSSLNGRQDAEGEAYIHKIPGLPGNPVISIKF